MEHAGRKRTRAALLPAESHDIATATESRYRLVPDSGLENSRIDPVMTQAKPPAKNGQAVPAPVPDVTFPALDGPDLGAMVNLHDSHDGHVLFTTAENMRPLAAIPANRLGEILPGLLPELDEGAYYSTKGYRPPPSSRIPAGYTKQRNVSHLAYAWVDIDGRNAPGGPVKQWQIISDVLRLVEGGRIPQPSVFVDSGRGVWLFWKLSPAERATPAAMDALVRVNGAAAELFARLGADIGARSIHWTRVPGSRNPKAENRKRCAYLFAADAAGEPITYTLDELVRAFDVSADRARADIFDAPPPPLDDGREVDPIKSRAGRIGWVVKWRNMSRVLLALQNIRGGFTKGTRELAAHYLAFTMLHAGIPPADAIDNLSRRGMFHPPLSDAQIRKHVNGARRQARTVKRGAGKPTALGYQRIADDLAISPAEATALRELTGIDAVRHIHQNREPEQAPPPSRAAKRRARIAELRKQQPTASVRRLKQLLELEGWEVARGTVQSDLKALGLNKPPRPKGPVIPAHPTLPGLLAQKPADKPNVPQGTSN